MGEGDPETSAKQRAVGSKSVARLRLGKWNRSRPMLLEREESKRDSSSRSDGRRGLQGGALSLPDTQLGEEECVVQSDFAKIVVAAGSAAVTRSHIDFEEQWVRIGFQPAQFSHVF